MARVENSSRSFEKTLNAWDWTPPEKNSFSKGSFYFEKRRRKIATEASAIETIFLFCFVFVSKGSYQSLSPKTLKEEGRKIRSFGHISVSSHEEKQKNIVKGKALSYLCRAKPALTLSPSHYSGEILFLIYFWGQK